MNNSHDNFFLIQKLLHESTLLLRNIFVNKYKELKHEEWKDNEESGKYFQSPEGKCIVNSTKFSSQKNYLIKGDSNLWDLSLLKVIFSNHPFKDNNFKYIQTICDIRNEIFHNSNFSLNDDYFENLWSKLTNELIALGHTNDKLNELKQRKIEKKNVNEELNDLKERAKEEFGKQNYKEAINLYTSALALDIISDEESSILYCNRSFSYYKLYTNSENLSDDRNLLKALSDAMNSSNLNQKWYKPYVRLGQIFKSLNDLEKAIENFEIALMLSPDDNEIKNVLADVKYKNYEQTREAHFDKNTAPYTFEEVSTNRYESYGEKVGFNKEMWEKGEKLCDTIMRKRQDVLKGHEFYLGSINVKIDYEQAAKYYGKAARKGNAEGIYNLAQMYENGRGVKQDFKMAFELFNRASEMSPFLDNSEKIANIGVAQAEHVLGIWYSKGIYVEKDYRKAASYYKRAIEHEFPQSGNNLGLLYFEGHGVEKDFNKAESYFLLAYRAGETLAITNLMYLYLEKNDPKKALLWHERGIEKNEMYHLVNDKYIREIIMYAEVIGDPLKVTESFIKEIFYGKFNFDKKENKQKNDKSFLNDQFRVNLIKTHRADIKNNLNYFSTQKNVLRNTFKPPREQKIPAMKRDLKEVFLNEIDFSKDHILNDYVLNATIIDIPDHIVSFFFIIEDHNRNVERLAVYNLGDNYQQVANTYKIGTKISIINPYIRMAADFKPMIRVDDPRSIVINPERKEKMCRYCGEENSKYLCGRCNKACYCSKECQVNDYKILDHKLICFI